MNQQNTRTHARRLVGWLDHPPNPNHNSLALTRPPAGRTTRCAGTVPTCTRQRAVGVTTKCRTVNSTASPLASPSSLPSSSTSNNAQRAADGGGHHPPPTPTQDNQEPSSEQTNEPTNVVLFHGLAFGNGAFTFRVVPSFVCWAWLHG